MTPSTRKIVSIEQHEPVQSSNDFWRWLTRNTIALVSLVVFIALVVVAVIGPLVYHTSATRVDYAALNSLPTADHPLGTDSLGRDTLARLIHGLRVSLVVAFFVELLNITLGATLGLLAGYYGGVVDIIVTRIADALFAFPGLLLAILIAAIFGEAASDAFGGMGRLLLVTGALSLVSWPLMGRFVRGQTLLIRELDFVTAAHGVGASPMHIMRFHIVPQLVGLILTSSTLNIASVVVNEAILSLLGLGIQPPEPSIGKMITDARPYLESNPLQVFLPSAVLMTIVLTVSFLGDALRDYFDPQTRTER